MNIDIESIRKLFGGDPDNSEQYIIAGGDEDMTAGQILDWIMPMMQGMTGRKWATCEFELQGDNVVFARYRSSRSKVQYNYYDDWSTDEADGFRAVVPGPAGLVIVAISSYSSQIFTLMDGVASWLSMFDPQQPEMRPLRRLLATFEDMVRIGG